MSEFKIERNIPVSPKGRGPGRSEKYPFADMKPGDSFCVPTQNGQEPRQLQSTLAGCWTRYIKAHAPDAKFTTRQVDGGVRVWRVK